MPFTLIRGTYHVVGYSPDGDTIRFQPEDTALLQMLRGKPAKINSRNHVSLRIEAIDALETHYGPPAGGGVFHQPLSHARPARDGLLSFVGIENVEWDSAENTVINADDGTPGYILARATEKNGRIVAFVYRGVPPEEDGASVRLDAVRLQDSYNHFAVSQGFAYPTYYRGLFHDLRDELTRVAISARAEGKNVYAIDRTTVGFDALPLTGLTRDFGVLPKLFRRLIEYITNHNTTDGFKETLARAPEPVLDLRTNNFTNFDTFVEQKNGSARIALTRFPEELVFDEMATAPANLFSMVVNVERVPLAGLPGPFIVPEGLTL